MGGEAVLGESTSYIFRFYLFLTLLHNFNSLARKNIFVWQKALAQRSLTLSLTWRHEK
jgi:hypothetical protein